MQNIIITDTILNKIIDIEVNIEKLRGISISSDIVSKVHDDVNIDNLMHISNLLSLNNSYSEVKSIYLGKTLSTDELKDDNSKFKYQILINYRRYQEYISSILDSPNFDIDSNFLSHINRLLMYKIKEEWEIKLRDGKLEDDLGFLYDLEVEDQSASYKELDSILAFINKNLGIKHVSLLASYLLFELIRLNPWSYGNKISIIALFEYMIKRGGLDANGLYPTTMYLDEFRFESQRTMVYVMDNMDKSNLWYERFVQNYSDSLRKKMIDFQTKISQYERDKNKNNSFLSLNKRQLKILKYLQNIPQVKREDYVHMMEVSTMTAYRDLNELVDKKLLKVVGSGRGTKYMLTIK